MSRNKIKFFDRNNITYVYMCLICAIPFPRKPVRSHVETEVICSIPHKITLRASGPEESTAKHPKKGVSYIRLIYFQLLSYHLIQSDYFLMKI